MTHCSAWGFEASENSGILSDPYNWELVLKQHNDLRLCYGHSGSAGGGKNGELYPGWCASETEWHFGNNFTKKVIDHCRQYRNVYCDISYLAEVLDDEECANNFKRNFIQAYKDDNDERHNYKFADKVMFGSDWHMPAMAYRSSKFLDFMIDVFFEMFPDGDIRKTYKEKFFHENACHFLKV